MCGWHRSHASCPSNETGPGIVHAIDCCKDVGEQRVTRIYHAYVEVEIDARARADQTLAAPLNRRQSAAPARMPCGAK
jgi:hypothetical protein